GGERRGTRAPDTRGAARARGGTGDGQPTSAPQVISLINKDAIRTSSTDRIIGDEIARDLDDIIMVRKPRAPGAAVTPPKPATPAPTTSPEEFGSRSSRPGPLGGFR